MKCLRCGAAIENAQACGACGLALRRDAEGVLSLSDATTDVEYPETGADVLLAVEETSFWFRHRNAVLSALLARFAPGAALWDVGGGNGFPALALQREGRDVVMIEPGPAGARNAARRGVRTVVRATLEDLKLRDATVPAISFLDVVEHLPDPQPLLREARRVIVHGGKLLVTVPAYQILWSDEDDYARHQRRYTARRLADDLRAAGFEIDYLGYYFQFLALPIFLLRTLPWRLMPWRRGRAAPTTDASEHEPRGLGAAVMSRMLARELAAIRGGRRLRFGASVVAVARAP